MQPQGSWLNRQQTRPMQGGANSVPMPSPGTAAVPTQPMAAPGYPPRPTGAADGQGGAAAPTSAGPAMGGLGGGSAMQAAAQQGAATPPTSPAPAATPPPSQGLPLGVPSASFMGTPAAGGFNTPPPAPATSAPASTGIGPMTAQSSPYASAGMQSQAQQGGGISSLPPSGMFGGSNNGMAGMQSQMQSRYGQSQGGMPQRGPGPGNMMNRPQPQWGGGGQQGRPQYSGAGQPAIARYQSQARPAPQQGGNQNPQVGAPAWAARKPSPMGGQ